jgi:membrane associated rhomboid family serine protease
VFLPLKDENPIRCVPWVTGGLIAANVAVFLYEVSGPVEPARLVTAYGFVPARFSGPVDLLAPAAGAPTTLLTSLFLHANLVHLLGNLLHLWIFGNNVEDVLGHFRFLLFYLLAGLGGHAAHFLANSSSPVPTIGASGAIAGVLAAYLVRFPGARIVSLVFLVFFVRLVRVPAGVVIGFWLVTQIVGGAGELGRMTQGGIAWFEHLGGFAVGLVAFGLLGGLGGRGR